MNRATQPVPAALAAALLLFPLAALQAADDRPGDAPPGKLFVYKHSGGEPQELEVYFPKDWDPAKKKAPGVLFFHGGGWTGGDLRQFRDACYYLASRGLVAATANYRMLSKKEAAQRPQGESHKRPCITDAKSAIRWMKQHADTLGIDPDRLIAGGGSAGGHVAVLATLNPGLDDPNDPQQFDASVVAYLLFNPAFSPDDSKDSEVNVLKHLRADFPPAVVFFGTADGWKQGWDAVDERLKRLGATRPTLWLAEGQPHGFFNRQPWKDVTLAAADRFLVEQGLLKGESPLASPASGEKLVPARPVSRKSQAHEEKGPSSAAGRPAEAQEKLIHLFDGKTLDGWMVKCRPEDKDKAGYWRVVDGTITAETTPGSKHNYIWLLTEREYGDFEMTLKVQTYSTSTANSGIQVRSRYDDESNYLDGPQVDIHPPGPWRCGFLYDETRGAQVWLWPDVGGPFNARPEHAPAGWQWHHADEEGPRWNDVRVVCQGMRIQTFVNGLAIADYDGRGRLDDEAHRRRNVGLRGHIGLQIHPGGDLLIRFKDIDLRPL